ncbi:hypothetical protein AGMMS49983_22220 [Clostridia bacterium]|nr:hypothetical protein AGMMS49983_22220 [Clostridia bacterium]
MLTKERIIKLNALGVTVNISIDERSCIHAKSTLKFLIEDLYSIALGATTN